MDLDNRIRKLTNAVKYCKPNMCKGCKFIHEDSFARSCELMDGGFDSVIEYELANNKVAYNCPLLEKDSEEYNEIVEQLELLVELKEARIKLQESETIKGGRYNGKRALAMLEEIERISREAFNNPDTQDINLYRSQALAKIFQIFEYNGSTIKTEKEA